MVDRQSLSIYPDISLRSWQGAKKQSVVIHSLLDLWGKMETRGKCSAMKSLPGVTSGRQNPSKKIFLVQAVYDVLSCAASPHIWDKSETPSFCFAEEEGLELTLSLSLETWPGTQGNGCQCLSVILTTNTASLLVKQSVLLRQVRSLNSNNLVHQPAYSRMNKISSCWLMLASTLSVQHT